MKHANAIGIALFFFSILLTSCTSEKVFSLSLEGSSCEVRLDMGKSIQISSGNEDYSVTVKDPDIASASINIPPAYETHYSLYIGGKQKGTTTVTVRDNVTKETIEVEVKIVDSYLPFHIGESDYTQFPQNSYLFLVSNEARDFYIFEQEAQSPKLKGTYEFSVDDYLPYLTLSYPSGDKTETTTFSLGESSPYLYSLLDLFFKTNMVEGMTRYSPAPTIIMQMDEINTDKKLRTLCSYNKEIPKNVLE